jgi:hypothetical protein
MCAMRLRRHLTISNALALTALFLALTAGAYAAGLGRNSVKSKQIKDGGVMTQDLRDGAVTGAKIANGSLTGADFADDSLTGSDIAEGSLLGLVAADADHAGGLQFQKIDYQTPIANGAVKSIVAFPNIFRIDAQCANVGDGLDITAFTAFDNSSISLVVTRGAGADDHDGAVDVRSTEDVDFDTSDALGIDNLFMPSAANFAVIRFSTPNGTVIEADFMAVEAGGGCSVIGTAVGG